MTSAYPTPVDNLTEQVRALARTHRPKAIVCGSIAYPRHIDYAFFREVRR